MSENNLNSKETNSRVGTCTCNEERRENAESETTCRCRENYSAEKEQLLRQAESSCTGTRISETELQEVYKNACTGKESVEILKRFSSDKGFRNLLIRQYKDYSSIAKETELYANSLGYKLEKTSVFAKAMMYMTTAMSTMADKSDSKLSEIMMQGINMGIIALTKLNNRLAEENRSCELSDSLLALLTKHLEEMKLFL